MSSGRPHLRCRRAVASAQESKSAPLAKQLAAALDAGKLDSIAANDPSAPDVVRRRAVFSRHAAARRLGQVLGAAAADRTRWPKKEYRDVYLDLNGASIADTKVFIEDPGADGLKAKREDNQAFDQCEMAGKRTMFDGDWKTQKMSEQDYMKAFTAADDRYSQILTALLAQAKKSS